jgi:hypothetical protein
MCLPHIVTVQPRRAIGKGKGAGARVILRLLQGFHAEHLLFLIDEADPERTRTIAKCYLEADGAS